MIEYMLIGLIVAGAIALTLAFGWLQNGGAQNDSNNTNKSAVQYAKEMSSDDGSLFMQAYTAQSRNAGTACVLAMFSLDRAYLGQVFLSLLKIALCFLIVGFVWVVADLFSVKQRTREFNRLLAAELKREMEEGK